MGIEKERIRNIWGGLGDEKPRTYLKDDGIEEDNTPANHAVANPDRAATSAPKELPETPLVVIERTLDDLVPRSWRTFSDL